MSRYLPAWGEVLLFAVIASFSAGAGYMKMIEARSLSSVRHVVTVCPAEVLRCGSVAPRPACGEEMTKAFAAMLEGRAIQTARRAYALAFVLALLPFVVPLFRRPVRYLMNRFVWRRRA